MSTRRAITRLMLATAFGAAVAGDAGAQARADIPLPSWEQDPKFAEIAIDASSGTVLYGHNATARRHIASLTKVMTAYLVFEAFAAGKLTPDQALPVSARAAALYSKKLPLTAGQTMKTREALNAITSISSNGATVVLAEAVAGSESAFADKMTEKAKALGAANTVWKTSSGLTAEGQFSTAYDIAIVFAALKRDYPAAFEKYFSARTVTVRGVERGNCSYCGSFNIVGHKSGFTNAAGKCWMAATENGPSSRIIVSLGAPANPKTPSLAANRVLKIASALQKNP